MQSLKHSFKEVSVSHAQLAHFNTLAEGVRVRVTQLYPPARAVEL